jgi:hypothetical protein
MKDWYSSLYKACIIAGMISFILGFFTNSKTSLGAYIAGYSVLILAILMILIVVVKNILTIGGNDSMIQFTYSILMATGPFLLILGVIIFVLYLSIKYQNTITNDKTAPGYDSFSNIIVILLLLQVYLVYSNVSSEKFDTSVGLTKLTSSIVYLTGVITVINSTMLYRILEYYSTDGFSSLINF